MKVIRWWLCIEQWYQWSILNYQFLQNVLQDHSIRFHIVMLCELLSLTDELENLLQLRRLCMFQRNLHGSLYNIPDYQHNDKWWKEYLRGWYLCLKWITLTVTSTVTMSPFRNFLSSGIPWTTMLLTDVQIDLGNPLKPNGEGYAPFCIIKSWANASKSSVVLPTCILNWK